MALPACLPACLPDECLPEDEVAAAELEDEAEGVVADEIVAEEAGGARGRRGRRFLAHDRSEELVELLPTVRHAVRTAGGGEGEADNELPNTANFDV